ncbi:MAG: hypothetical protein HY040_14055 [Planctomycetes bacterium]|nr:hypothetical protein [Planctomycetota bacterium]
MSLIAAAAFLGCRIFFIEESDVQWIGPKTRQIRELMTLLESPVDLSHLQGTMSARRALELLHEQLFEGDLNLHFFVNMRDGSNQVPQDHFLDSQIKLPCGKMTAIQFIRALLDQVLWKKAVLLLRQDGLLEITTPEHARRERAAYEKAVGFTPLDSVWQWISEFFGNDGPLPIPYSETNAGSLLFFPQPRQHRIIL